MADRQFDVLLNFLTNAAKTEKEVEALSSAVNDFDGAFPGDKLGEDFKKFNEQLKKTKTTAKETTAALRAEAKLLRAEAAAIVDDLKARQIGALKEVSSFIGGISTTSLVAGTAIVGGIFAAANNYVKNAKVATRVTDEWNAATASLSRSQDQVGATLAKVSLPLLQKAARLADQASDFIERNPEIVQAALNTGLVLAGLGAVGLAVSKGIKLYADVLYLGTIPAQLTAAKLQDVAADKQLAAAGLRAKELGLKLPGTAAAATGIGTVGLVAAGAAAQGGIALNASGNINKLGVSIAEATKNAGLGATVITALTTALTPLFPMLPGIQSIKANLPQITTLLEKFGLVAKKTKEEGSLSEAVAGVQGSEQFQAVLSAYEDYKRDDLALVQQHYADRQKTIADSLADEKQSNERFAQTVSKIRQQASNAITQATQQFTQANTQAEQQYAQQRADIIQSGAEDIKQIEQNLQETLRRNALDHENRMEDLTASRDALGLSKERRRFLEGQDEARHDAGLEVKQRRAEITQRLADLRASFEQERAQRQVDLQARLAEIRTNLQQELAEQQAQHQAEIRQIQAQRAAKLRELDAQLAAERQRRNQYFIQQVRDLDVNLLGERNLRQRRQQEMIQDLDDFLAQYKAGLRTMSATPATSHAGGGYASYGTYLLGDAAGGSRGKREYVLSGRTTELAQRVLGSLTQEKLLSALMMAGGNRSATYVDQRRIDQSASKWSKNDMRGAAEDALLSIMGA